MLAAIYCPKLKTVIAVSIDDLGAEEYLEALAGFLLIRVKY